MSPEAKEGTEMTRDRQTIIWIAGFAVLLVLLHLLSSILLPFVAGMAIAYFLDPVADWLEERKLSRALEIQSDYSGAHNAIAILYERLGKPESARKRSSSNSRFCRRLIGM